MRRRLICLYALVIYVLSFYASFAWGANRLETYAGEPVTESIFFDDFESYMLGTGPGTGGWQLIYNGAGTSSQYVDNAQSVSGSQSLHLVGSSCWSANAYHHADITPKMILDAKIFVAQIVGCGCSPILSGVGFSNPQLNNWGTAFGNVTFDCDGKVYATPSTYDRNNDILLMSYNARTWYHVKLSVDLTARTFDVYIDDILMRSGLQILDSGTPTGVEVSAGHGGNPTVWFDDVKVTSLQGAQQYILTVGKAGTGSGTVASNPGSINCGNSCSASFGAGAVTLTATEDSGSTFTSWSGCDSTNGNQCTVTMSAPRSVTAIFTLNPTQQYTLSITKSGTGNGRVTSSQQGIDCGSVCSAKCNQGTVVTLTAEPDISCIFTGWNGGGCTGAGACITTLNADTTVTAAFTAQVGTPQISVSPKSVNFGSINIENTSDPKTITIKNKGKGYLAINSITITGTNAGEFNQTNNCSTIFPGSSCTISGTFSPASTLGKKTAIISISSNDPKRPTLNVKLSGQSSPKISIEGTWDIGGTETVTVSSNGRSQTVKVAFSDEFTFYSDGSFEMLDMDGTWSQKGLNFSVNLDSGSVSTYFADNLSEQLDSDVYVDVTKITFTGSKQKNGTIKGSFKLSMTFYIQDYGVTGKITASASFKGTQQAQMSMSSVREKKSHHLPGSILNVIKKEVDNTFKR